MWNRDWQDLDVADEEWDIGFDDVRPPLGLGRTRDRPAVIEDIGELAAKTLERLGRAVHRERRVPADSECAEVVGAVGVIGVIVREEHGIDAVEPRGDELEAQLGRRVDEYSHTRARLDKGTDTGALVAGIRGPAHLAPASQHGDAEARASSEEEKAHSRDAGRAARDAGKVERPASLVPRPAFTPFPPSSCSSS